MKSERKKEGRRRGSKFTPPPKVAIIGEHIFIVRGEQKTSCFSPAYYDDFAISSYFTARVRQSKNLHAKCTASLLFRCLIALSGMAKWMSEYSSPTTKLSRIMKVYSKIVHKMKTGICK